jgi:hypothetical protein
MKFGTVSATRRECPFSANLASTTPSASPIAENEHVLVHRHADPLVRSVMLEQAAALARGLRVNEMIIR